MSASRRITLLIFLASFLMSAYATCVIYFYHLHKDHNLQLLIGISVVLILTGIIGKMLAYQQALVFCLTNCFTFLMIFIKLIVRVTFLVHRDWDLLSVAGSWKNMVAGYRPAVQKKTAALPSVLLWKQEVTYERSRIPTGPANY